MRSMRSPIALNVPKQAAASRVYTFAEITFVISCRLVLDWVKAWWNDPFHEAFLAVFDTFYDPA